MKITFFTFRVLKQAGCLFQQPARVAPVSGAGTSPPRFRNSHNDETGIAMTRTLCLCATLSLLLLSTGSQAAGYAGTTFEIELIAFSRDSGMAQSRETWPTAPQMQYPREWIDFSTLTEEGTPLLTPAVTQLDNKAAALDRDGYRVLLHKAWRQVLQNKQNSPAILISGGTTLGGMHQLEGSITLSVARYLHLSTNLWFSEFASGPEVDAIPLPSKPVPPPPPTAEPLGLTQVPTDTGRGTGGALATAYPAEVDYPTPVFARHVTQLRQERRLRSGELHYLDNPEFGILLQVRTVEAPEAPTTATE
ncbi:CsiV family protein [Microbulbifer sp. 2201CG32-9]|uniref:CsiV family protein n=1 Tax=Microbulbifer sp. 2201CG32-9 TaxID=3232309 RepID=UPI00345BE16D